MEIILLKDIEKVGNKLDIVTVKDGYGRNYLIPKKLAMIANAKNKAKIDEIKAKEAAEMAERLEECKELSEKIQSAVLKVGAKAGASNKIFGSVSNIQLANALNEQLGIEIERRKIELLEEVKELGTYKAKVDLHPELETILTFEVFED